MRAGAWLPACLPYSILFHRDPDRVCDYALHCCTAQPLSCFRFFHPLTALLAVALHTVSNDTDINVSGTGAQTPLFWGSLLNMVYMMCAMVLVVTGPAEFQRESTHWKATLHYIHALHVQNKLDCGGRPEEEEGGAEGKCC